VELSDDLHYYCITADPWQLAGGSLVAHGMMQGVVIEAQQTAMAAAAAETAARHCFTQNMHLQLGSICCNQVSPCPTTEPFAVP
jgi:hypothetical protein